jgi:predicted nucleic acid-binding protein
MILVDTSSLVHFLRRKGEAQAKERVRAILRRGDAALCPMIRVELAMGVASDRDSKQVAALCDAMVDLPITDAVWTEAERLGRECRRLGKPVPASDLVIAAAAFVHGAAVEAEDEHFRLLDTLRRR